MVIRVSNQQNLRPIDLSDLKGKIRRILDALASDPVELSVVLLDDEGISLLNRRYLGREGPTNVIAFPMGEGPFAADQLRLLGDVAVSVETAVKEAALCGRSWEERLDALLIHGILHLLGFDHETDEAEARRMEAKEEEVWKLLYPHKEE